MRIKTVKWCSWGHSEGPPRRAVNVNLQHCRPHVVVQPRRIRQRAAGVASSRPTPAAVFECSSTPDVLHRTSRAWCHGRYDAMQSRGERRDASLQYNTVQLLYSSPASPGPGRALRPTRQMPAGAVQGPAWEPYASGHSAHAPRLAIVSSRPDAGVECCWKDW